MHFEGALGHAPRLKPALDNVAVNDAVVVGVGDDAFHALPLVNDFSSDLKSHTAPRTTGRPLDVS